MLPQSDIRVLYGTKERTAEKHPWMSTVRLWRGNTWMLCPDFQSWWPIVPTQLGSGFWTPPFLPSDRSQPKNPLFPLRDGMPCSKWTKWQIAAWAPRCRNNGAPPRSCRHRRKPHRFAPGKVTMVPHSGPTRHRRAAPQATPIPRRPWLTTGQICPG
jgi:hypothetical protein